jgi:hypothetical protein
VNDNELAQFLIDKICRSEMPILQVNLGASGYWDARAQGIDEQLVPQKPHSMGRLSYIQGAQT